MAETKVSEQMKEMFMSQITLRLFQEPNKTRKDKSLLINDVNNPALLRCVTHYLFTFVGATTSTASTVKPTKRPEPVHSGTVRKMVIR